jgi:hypothetical protein
MGAAKGMRMGLLFKDDLLDEFDSWPIAYTPHGGADFGEIAAVAKAVGGGDASGFHTLSRSGRLAPGGLCLSSRRAGARDRRHVRPDVTPCASCGPLSARSPVRRQSVCRSKTTTKMITQT